MFQPFAHYCYVTISSIYVLVLGNLFYNSSCNFS